MQIEIQTYDGEQLSCRAKWKICYRCGGSGLTDPPEFVSGFSADEFADDRDFSEEYMQGPSDVPCQECDGRGSVLVPDPEDSHSEAVMEFVSQQRKGLM